MKRIIRFILLSILLLSMTACTGKHKDVEVADKEITIDLDTTNDQLFDDKANETISSTNEISIINVSTKQDSKKTEANNEKSSNKASIKASNNKNIGSKNADKELSELEELSKSLALKMNKGEFKEIIDYLSPIVKLQLTEKVLKQSWDSAIKDLGSFKGIREIREEVDETNTEVIVILNYDTCGLQILFSYNKDKKLDTLWIEYAPYEPEIVSNDDFEESEISFGDSKKPIKGILTLPINVKKPPVAILVHGSGNHDADESIGSNKPFRDLAYGLARHGIAVIRYNESNSQSTNPEFTIQDDSLNDASWAIKYAQKLGKVDTDRIYIIGHSLGGMMAPKIAADNKEVDGIVSLAGSPRKLEDIVLDQNRILLQADKTVTPAKLNIHMAQVQMAVNKIKNLKESSSEIILGYPASYWYSLNQIDIPKIVKKLNIPIFIAQGSADFQVYADIDYVAWQELLKDKDNVTFRLYDNLNHLFMTSNGRMDFTEYNIKGTVDSQLIDDIAEWILSK